MSAASVFVLDDDPPICQILKRTLQDQEFEVATHQSVREALGSVQQRPFDAYVLDYRLPDGDGLEVAERIRGLGSTAPIILISGFDDEELLDKAGPLRVSDFLKKPFTIEHFCAALRRSMIASSGSRTLPLPVVSLAARADMVRSPLLKQRPRRVDRLPGVLLRLGAALLLFLIFR